MVCIMANSYYGLYVKFKDEKIMQYKMVEAFLVIYKGKYYVANLKDRKIGSTGEGIGLDLRDGKGKKIGKTNIEQVEFISRKDKKYKKGIKRLGISIGDNCT